MVGWMNGWMDVGFRFSFSIKSPLMIASSQALNILIIDIGYALIILVTVLLFDLMFIMRMLSEIGVKLTLEFDLTSTSVLAIDFSL